MRNKIKQLLKKEDGFTLVELLGVIVILGLIIAIAIPSVNGIMDNARKTSNNAQIELVRDAVQLYEVEHGEVDENTLTITELINKNFLTQEEVNNWDLGAVTSTTTIKNILDKYKN